MSRTCLGLLSAALGCTLLAFAAGPERSSPKEPPPRFGVPPGFVVEKVAGPPLVRYPLFAAFDDRGRLFVAEGTGTNLPGPELLKLKKQLGRITLLEDTDGDGVFDKSTVFADDLTFPTGVLWHDGALYAASHPNVWRFEDTDGDGKADRREALVGKFNFNGNGCDVHGPFLGPEGRLYWTEGRHGYKVRTREGELLEGLASRVWRCRTDGTEIERLCGGGFDNPVELAFTAAGDLLGTMDQGPGDALLHYVEGGVYPMDHPCVQEFARTGPMLGSVRQFSAALPVALCGLMRYRSGQFGPGYEGSFFTAQFNVHRVQQHTLVPDGATFRSVDKDFLTSTDYDTHFTDVLEDADGSLLVVDMGAWFNYGCPTSKIAKPEVLGAIYRIRRMDAPAVADPWGKSLKLASRSPEELLALLKDDRPRVRDQAVEQLGKRGAAAVPALARILPDGKVSVQTLLNAVWALCRIRTPEARAVLREALGAFDPQVRQAAVHAVGVEKDAEAVKALMKLAVEDEPRLRLKAAEGLGRIGKPEAVPALLESLRRGGDRFLEHAVIYALIRINDPKATQPALADPNPRVRQAALVALDQMKAGQFTREQVVPLLDTDDPELQQAALEVMGRRPGWSGEVTGLLRTWLTSPTLSDRQQTSLTGALLAFGGQADVQRLVAEALASPKTALPTRLLLLRVLGRARVEPLPAAWRAALEKALGHEDLAVRREAVSVVKARNLADFDGPLAALARQPDLPAELRIAALDCVSPRQRPLGRESFALLTAHLSEKTEPLLRVAAARALGASHLDPKQLTDLAGHLASAGPMVLPLAVPAFGRSREGAAGLALVEALKRSQGAEALAADDLDKVLQNYPAEVREAARPLRERLAARQKGQAAYLGELTSQLVQTPGDAERGKEVFFSRKAACYGCHRAAGKGGSVGPDLSQVGRFRTPRDLLESIVFPSSSIVPEFRAFAVHTRDGRVTVGMIVRETSDAVFLRTAQLAEVRLARADVEEMTPSPTSIMPEGLEKTMSRQELGDLLEFLSKQR
jgi:putative heme-binding domain-containing protein